MALPLSRGWGSGGDGDALRGWADQNRADASAENEGMMSLLGERWLEIYVKG